MGKKSKSGGVSKVIYGNTTTTNPYITSKTDNKGTVSAFNKGTAFNSINDFVNNNMGTILDQYLNPTLNSTTNQSKLNSFIDTLNRETYKDLENNIVNPLSNRNMIRSSQATNLYNNLASNNNSSISNYANDLLANSQANTANLINTLMLSYMNAYSAMSDNQKQSLMTSQGNSTKSQQGTGSSFDMTEMIKMSTDLLLNMAQTQRQNPQ